MKREEFEEQFIKSGFERTSVYVRYGDQWCHATAVSDNPRGAIGYVFETIVPHHLRSTTTITEVLTFESLMATLNDITDLVEGLGVAIKKQAG